MAEAARRETKRQGKEGNRWVNMRPGGEELSKWFTDNVPIAEGLDAANYVAGVTLIPAKEKIEEVVAWDQSNSAILGAFWDLVLTPYIRVDTRLKYFHDLMARDDTLGLIQPVATEEQDPRLPRGFFRLVTATGANKEVRFVGCTMQATVYKKGSLQEVKVFLDKRTGEEGIVQVGKIVRRFTPATKVVPILNYKGEADNFALMKAETGAVGRALGMAGMLVIPGTGLATAEDLQEVESMVAQARAGGSLETPTLPDDAEPASQIEAEGSDEELRQIGADCIEELGEFPQVLAEFKAWAKERGYARLSEVTQPALRGLVRRAQNMLLDARNSLAPDAEPADGDPLPE